MLRAFALLVLSCAFAATACAATSATDPDLSLSLFRAVRLSNTSITISFKTNQAATGQVRYTQPGDSEIRLTDAEPQTDHLFTIDQVDPNHGYSFALSATSGADESNEYVILLAPSSIGVPGQSIVPGIQVTGANGELVQTLLAASSTPIKNRSVIPWWVFALLFIVVIGGWVGLTVYRKKNVVNIVGP